MDLHLLPATSFAFLFQYTMNQTLKRDSHFEDYLKLTEFVSTIQNLRFRATVYMLQISQSKSCLDVKELIDQIELYFVEKKVDHHYGAYVLYMLGAYSGASSYVEKHFEKNHKNISRDIDKIKGQLDVKAAAASLNEAIGQFLQANSIESSFSVRIKKNGSIFAKLISTGKFLPQDLINTTSPYIATEMMPYDVVGGGITFNKINGKTKHLVTRLTNFFSKNGIALVDQNAYSPEWMFRKSLIGLIETKYGRVPFQIHLWDRKAERYEFMSYGNYKLNKLFYPLFDDWSIYLDKEIDHSMYIKLVIAKITSRGFYSL